IVDYPWLLRARYCKSSRKFHRIVTGILILDSSLLLLGGLLLSLFADRIAAFLLFHPWKPNANTIVK
ncbi:MAG: hypothetical protein FWC43_04515, partial [Planctomycetaceae bacterium]|nr:hypothetical protein [Planctomycetaceae bacterium]